MTAFRIIGIAMELHSVVLSVAVDAEVHEVWVTPAGAVLVPCGLALHPLRCDIEAECQQVAAQARLVMGGGLMLLCPIGPATTLQPAYPLFCPMYIVLDQSDTESYDV